MVEILKLGKFAVLAPAVAVAVGCPSKGGDTSGEGANGSVDPDAGYSANSGAVDGSLSDEAASRATTIFYFEYDSSDLKPGAIRVLDVRARDLEGSDQCAVLEGHTGECGTREYNMALGERRARVVQCYLVLQGISPAQLEPVSYGKERPAAIGHDEQPWAQNRCVEPKE